MRALFHKPEQGQISRPEPSHLTIVDDPPITDGCVSGGTLNQHTPIRWVAIGGKAFGVTPETVYKGILASGDDYYPYYDDNLTTIDNDDLPTYDNIDLIGPLSPIRLGNSPRLRSVDESSHL